MGKIKKYLGILGLVGALASPVKTDQPGGGEIGLNENFDNIPSISAFLEANTPVPADKWNVNQATGYLELTETTGPLNSKFYFNNLEYAEIDNYKIRAKINKSPKWFTDSDYAGIILTGNSEANVQYRIEINKKNKKFAVFRMDQTGSILYAGENPNPLPNFKSDSEDDILEARITPTETKLYINPDDVGFSEPVATISDFGLPTGKVGLSGLDGSDDVSKILVDWITVEYTPGGLVHTNKDAKTRGRYDALFLRGDANLDQNLDLSDIVKILDYCFISQKEPPCMRALDANDDGQVDIGDAIKMIFYKFLGDSPIPPPNESTTHVNGSDKRGPDETPDSLDCKFY